MAHTELSPAPARRPGVPAGSAVREDEGFAGASVGVESLVDLASPVGADAAAAGKDAGHAVARGRSAGPKEAGIAALFAGMAGLIASGPISDNSVLTHLATGRLQVSGGLPLTNPFLVSSTDFPVPSWWWSAALGWFERAAGLGAVRVFTVLVAAATGSMIVLAARPVVIRGGSAEGRTVERNAVAQALTALVLLGCLFPWLNARPHLGGFLLLAAMLVLWRAGRSPWWMTVLFGVWVNVHGSWTYGIGVLVLLWVAEMLDERSWDLRRLRWVLAALGGLLLGGWFYHERFRLVLLPFEQLGDPAARSVLRAYHEWRPPGFSSPLLWILVLLVILALYGALRPSDGKGIRFGTLFAVVALAVIGAGALRMLPLAAIVLAGFAATGVGAVTDRISVPTGIVWVASVLGVGLVAVALVRAWETPALDLSRYPVEEVDWLEQRGLVAVDDVRLIQNDWIGNYLELRFGEEANVWVDDRPSVATMVDYVTLRGLGDGWREAFARADPDVVLWQTQDPLPAVLDASPDWYTALATEDFRVLCHARMAVRCSAN